MRITDVRVATVPIKSEIRNAWIDFRQMTAAVVAVMTDVVRDGRPVVGYGFNSNGRYAPTSLLRERFIPRLLEAPPVALLTEDGSNLDPHKIWTWDPGTRRPYRGSPKRQLPMWHVYRVELFPHFGQCSGIRDVHGHELEFPSAFRQTRDGRPKGIIRVGGAP